ncbi:GntR family transcriptional regulator [Jannaschia sp. R86511]|uniref:GntR family transcriptional regulator n=1 Tax=Jannaschia sp. R86511 TaxID=3093853 RepID=UPI0036D34617
MTASPVRLSVDTDDPTPPYEQLRRQLERAVRHGLLTDGQRLPPIRQLARDLGLAVGTVARTYRELEAAGLVSGSRGGGTRVGGPGLGDPTAGGAVRRPALTDLATRYVADARSAGAGDADVLAAVRLALRAGTGP